MSTAIHQKVEIMRRGEDPFVLAKLPSGWVCLAESQPMAPFGLPGAYCVLFSDPVVSDLNALSLEKRAQWGIDLAKVGDALIKVCGAVRANYEIWGNQDPALHAHITPRFSSETEARRMLPPRQAYDWNAGVKVDFSSVEVQNLVGKLKTELTARG